MSEKKKSSRRDFVSKIALASAGLTFAQGIRQTVFASPFTTSSYHNPGAMVNGEKKFVPVMITPFKADSSIDYTALAKLIDFYLASGSKGLFANCLSSEMYHLTNEERIALTAFVVKHVKGAVPVVATGSFGNTITEQAEFAKKMYQTGVDAVILITSHFAAKDEDDTVLIKNLQKFLSLTDSIPMGTYECPSPYKRIITPQVLEYLLSTNRIVYHKDTCLDLDQIKVKLKMCNGSRLEFYDAHTPNTMYSLQMGARGMSAIAGNFYPEIFAWMCNNIDDPQKQEDVKWLQSELTRVDSIISKGYPVTAKYFLQKRGLPIELVSRTNKTPMTAEQKHAIDQVYDDVTQWKERLRLS
jgi:4-hydroxy-tetrahydrodipicolinate synthase